ncbi:hypothetical protein [Vibrio gigantis]|uniref:hypothetical protein n=1 Tax=Vibrio gigantis TaxID=296199 RepID=UPI001BFE64C4|nr:hypothetical protein [Vibrio gigantis]
MIDENDIQEIIEKYRSCTPEQKDILRQEIAKILEINPYNKTEERERERKTN